jgi:hypothetical protein
MPAKQPNQTASADDLDAGAYFPKAKDWLDIGRRRLKHRLAKLEGRLREEYGKRISYPIETEAAFYLLSGLGYRASRKNFDYCIRQGRLESPPREGRRLVWSRKHIIEFGMQLERLRYWLAGRHDEKKTCWELQEEWDQMSPAYDADLQDRIDSLDADGLLDLMVETSGKNARNVRAHISGYYTIRMWEQDEPLDAVTNELLQQLVEEGNADARRAVATTLNRRMDKWGTP